ncbi:MAG: hypothetical protein IAG10_32395, partial [Planctomycetaceae bacterium]|nr:hypothetical protein [Planctomycetaceae bacterium]
GDQLVEFDPAVPLQHQLLGRSEADANSSDARVDVRLTTGTYFLAISGAGNRNFHPFVVDSGVTGQAANYGVRIAVVGGRAPAGNPDQFAPDFEARVLGDDTPETASDLGDLSDIGRLQVSGVIGDDPFYDFSSEDPFAMNPAADVDLYHFSITGSGPHALVAETFAGRIGSPLDPALTLFRTDEFGTLQFVATNNNSLNPTDSTNGQFPFFTDAVLFSGLTEGDYFLAVSSSGNDAEYGPDGVFDPQFAHSGLNGGSVGGYVLDLLVYADVNAPQVIATTPDHDSTLDRSPQSIEVQFNELVNLQQLAYMAYLQVGENTVSAVFIEGADGTHVFPRLESYDTATGIARFLMLDALPNGEAELHLSGSLGLTDLAGNPLVGNDTSGDFVVRFTVNGAVRGSDGVSTTWRNEAGNDSLESAQNLGLLFPHELQSGVTLVRDAVTNAGQSADTFDFFRFELLQTQSYFFTRTNTGSEAAPAIKVLNSNGQIVPLASQPRGQGLLGFLPAGTYVLRVGSWDAATFGNVTYRVEIELGGAFENPTPLTSGAAPAVGIRLLSNGPAIPQANQLPIFFTPPVVETNLASASSAAIPNTLLRGFEAAPLGGSGGTVTTPSSETTLVRLFGFSNRDALFTGLDSLLRPSSRQTPFSLSDSDLLDLAPSESDRSADEETPRETVESESMPPEKTLNSSDPAMRETDDPSDSDSADSPSTSGEPSVEPGDAADADTAEGNSVSPRAAADDESMSAAGPLALIVAMTMNGSLLKADASHEQRRRPKGFGAWLFSHRRA